MDILSDLYDTLFKRLFFAISGVAWNDNCSQISMLNKI